MEEKKKKSKIQGIGAQKHLETAENGLLLLSWFTPKFIFCPYPVLCFIQYLQYATLPLSFCASNVISEQQIF